MNIRSMTDVERRGAAKAFVQTWTGRGDEKQDAQNFWRELLQSVYGVEKPESDVSFELRVKNGQTGSTISVLNSLSALVIMRQKPYRISIKKDRRDSLWL